VLEAPQHVQHVVGVDGREDQMAREGRLDGDLRRFGIADLAHEDLVGIVAQDGAQAQGEGEPLLLVPGDLRDALELVLDGILGGDYLVLGCADLAQHGVQGGGLARSRGARHQEHAIGFPGETAETLQLVIRKA